MHKFKEWFGKNALLVIIILQVLFILVLAIAAGTGKRDDFVIDSARLNREGEMGGIVSDMHLKSGSYMVTMRYRTDSEEANYQIADSYYIDNAMTGDLYGNLDYTKTTLNVPFWLYHDTEEFFVAWSADTQLTGLEIRETPSLDNERILFFAILFLVVDFLLWRFFKSASGDEKEVKRNRIWGVIAVTTLVSSLPLMINYLLDCRGDISFHLARIEGIYLGLLEGRFPVRMDGFMLRGQGYADPIFYPNLFLYIPALFRLAGVPILRAYKLFVGIWNLFTVLITYYSFKRIVKSDKAALLGMILFVLSPYRTLCLYGRGAVGEALAMTFFPMVAAGLWLLLQKAAQKNAQKSEKNADLRRLLEGTLFLTLGLTGILQSHILSCEMVGIIMILALLICIRRTIQLKTFLSLAISAVLVLLLNAWFLVPFLQSYGMELYVFDNFDLYLYENGLTIYQLLGTPLDLTGQSSLLMTDLTDEMGMCFGYAILLGILFMAFGIRTWAKYRKTEEGRGLPVLMILGTIAAYITTYYFPWKQVENIPAIGKLLCMVQFPWRYLGIATFCFCVAIMVYMQILEKIDAKRVAGEAAKDITNNAESVAANKRVNGRIDIFGESATGARKWFYYISMIVFAFLLANVHFHSLIENTEYFAPYSEVGLNQGRTMIQAEYLYSDTTIAGLREAARVDHPYYGKNCTLIFDLNEMKAEAYELATPMTYYPYYVAEDVETGSRFPIFKGEKGTAIIYVPENYAGTVKMYVPEMGRWILGDVISLVALVGLCAGCGFLMWKLRTKERAVEPKKEEPESRFGKKPEKQSE